MFVSMYGYDIRCLCILLHLDSTPSSFVPGSMNASPSKYCQGSGLRFEVRVE